MAKKQEEDEYRLAFEIVDKKAHIYVYEPIITEEEREKRVEELKKALQIFWEDYYRRKAIRKREEARASQKAVKADETDRGELLRARQ